MGLYRAVASEYILCPHDRKKIQEKRQTEKIHWEQKWFTALSIKKCGKKSALLKKYLYLAKLTCLLPM